MPIRKICSKRLQSGGGDDTASIASRALRWRCCRCWIPWNARLAVQSDDENIKNYVKGFEMIHDQLVAVLEKEGVKEIDALNQAV